MYAFIQKYNNPYNYPDYSQTLTPVDSTIQVTPVTHSLKAGTLRLSGRNEDFDTWNYMAYTRGGSLVYAWVDDWKILNDNLIEISYTVDLFRSYIDKVDLGHQFIVRSMLETYKQDSMLGTVQAYDDVEFYYTEFDDRYIRYMIVQLRAGEGEPLSETPVQPSIYQIWCCPYDIRDPHATEAIKGLLSTIRYKAQPQNIVSMYSLPYINLAGLVAGSIPLDLPSGNVSVPGWTLLRNVKNRLETQISLKNVIPIDINRITMTDTNVNIFIADAGVMNIPHALWHIDSLTLKMNVDLYTGAVNYSLWCGSAPTNISMRGANLAQIPIVSDVYDTYISQNQATLTASLLGDVATIGGGVAMMASGGGAAIGGGMALAGTQSLLTKGASIKDTTSTYSNPSAFLGSALAETMHKRVIIQVTSVNTDNAALVHDRYGWPLEKVAALNLPSSGGYVETQNCRVRGNVPLPALDFINSVFDNGLRIIV